MARFSPTFKFSLFFLLYFSPILIEGRSPLSPNQKYILSKNNPKTTNIIVTLNSDFSASVLAKVRDTTKKWASQGAKLGEIVGELKSAAATSQADILSFLIEQQQQQNNKSGDGVNFEPDILGSPLTFHPFWIINKILISGASSALIEKLAGRSDVRSVEREKEFPLSDFLLHSQLNETKNANFKKRGLKPKDEDEESQPNIDLIRAPQVWAKGQRGERAVVANIGTGVRHTHEILVDNFRGQNGWFDPIQGAKEPYDETGIGTHKMGVIVGKDGFGVAPGAKWIACKGCTSTGCTMSNLLKCSQWLLCPTDMDTEGTNADCDLAPNVVTNGWSGGQNDPWFDGVLSIWREGGILPIFDMGGSGPSCGSTQSPADSHLAVAVGAFDDTLLSAYPGGRGPTGDQRVKPQVSGPGIKISSAFHTADDAYITLSGASLGAPHAAGVVALIVSENPELTVDQVQGLLKKGAVHTPPTGQSCGGIPDSVFPNNRVGHGRVDAVNSISANK